MFGRSDLRRGGAIDILSAWCRGAERPICGGRSPRTNVGSQTASDIASERGWVAGLTTTLLPAGNVIGAISGAYLASTIGWRGLFLVGLAPAVVVSMIRYWVPESPRFLMRMGRHEEARRSSRLGLAV